MRENNTKLHTLLSKRKASLTCVGSTWSAMCSLAMASLNRIMLSSCRTVMRKELFVPDTQSRCLRRRYSPTMYFCAASLICSITTTTYTVRSYFNLNSGKFKFGNNLKAVCKKIGIIFFLSRTLECRLGILTIEH